MNKGLFITATGTDIGKTYVTGLLIKKLREAGLHAGYYKAALSGAKQTEQGLLPEDADYVNRIAGIGEHLENMVSYVYQNAVSPHLAAKIEGNPVELKVVEQAYRRVASVYDYVVMEGSGGIICPIRYDEQRIMLTDIIKELRLPTLVIADAGLGTINAVVLTIEYLRLQHIPVRGIVFNHYEVGNLMHEDNKRMVEELTKVPVLACVKKGDTELDIEEAMLVRLFL